MYLSFLGRICAGVVLTALCSFRGDFFMKEHEKADKVNMEEEPAFGNASFGIPADCTQKQKMSGIKLTCYIVVVLLVCSVVYGSYRAATSYFLPVMTFDKSAQPILYIKNSEVTLKTKEDRKGKSVVNSERFVSSDAQRYVQMSADGRTVFYAQDSADSAAGFDLCYRRVSAIDDDKDTPEEAVRIDGGVTDFKIHPEGQFVLYLKGTRLYFSNLTSAHVVASDVSDFYLSKNNQQIVYYKDGGKMYTCGTAKKDMPVLVDTEIDKVLSEKDEYAKVFYIKQGALFLKETDKEAVCLAEDVKDGILLGDYVYFVKEEVRPKRFQEVFYDDKAARDAGTEKPLKSDFMTPDETGQLVFDEAGYNAALKRFEEKEFRESIRNYFLINPVMEPTNVLYTMKRSGPKEVDAGLTEASLAYNSCRQAIVYKKKAKGNEKIRFSTVESVDDALLKIADKQAEQKENSLYVLMKDKMPFLGIDRFPGGQIEISLDGKFLYCIEDVGNDGRGTLVRYTMSAKELKSRKELREGVTDFALDGADSTIVMVFDGNKLGLSAGDTYTHLSDSSCHSFFYVDGTLYFFDDYDFASESGRLKTFRDGKIKLVDTSVHEFDARNLKTVAYIKHFNKEFGFGDLYLKSGNKRGRKQDICVRSILY